MTSITLGNSLTYLNNYIFDECPIKEIICYAENAPGPIPDHDYFDFGIDYSNVTLYIPAASKGYDAEPWNEFGTKKEINDYGFKLLNKFFDNMMIGESVSTKMQILFSECLDAISVCASIEQAQQKLDTECKPKLIDVWCEEKKAQLEAAKKGVDNDYVNEVYDECMSELNAAATKRDVGAIRQATTSGIAAVTSARLLYSRLQQGIPPVTPAGAGMRMKVTTQSDKVYEFKTQDVKSVEYYNKN